MLAKYDYKNPAALNRLLASGAQLRPFPQDVMNASFAATQEVYRGINATNAPFKKIYDSMVEFRAQSYPWQQVAEYTFDTFMTLRQRDGSLKPQSG